MTDLENIIACREAAEHEAERQWHMTHVCSPETCGWRELSEAEVNRLINEEQEGLE